MRNFGHIAAAAIASAMMMATAQAAPIVFKGNGLNATPTGNIVQNCGTIGADFCTVDHDQGFQYSVSGFDLTAKAYVGNQAVRLIQDIVPGNSGLGALSETNPSDDQTQTDSGEWIEFAFTRNVFLSDIEFNSGADRDCSNPGPEGPCGDFDFYIDNIFIATIAAVDLLTNTYMGASFKFVPVTVGGGFAIAQFDVNEVPIPAALPLLLSGLAGLGFASKRKKKIA